LEPGEVQAPVSIIRGGLGRLGHRPGRARWLFERLARSAERRDVTRTHLMHLEEMRTALWRESVAFLLGDDLKGT
jgi:hypothetical protein